MVDFISGALAGYLYYIIPFIFTFALVFGVLAVSKVFNQKNVNFLIAMSMAFFALFSEEYVTLLHEWLPYLCIMFILIFVGVMLRNLFFGDKNREMKPSWEMLITIAILFIVFMTVYESIPLPSGSIISSDDILLIAGIGFVVMILVVGSKLKDSGFEGGSPPGG